MALTGTRKKSVIVREQFASLFESVTDEQAGKLIKAMLAYQASGEASFDDPLMTAIFAMLRESIDRDNAEYEAVCEKRRQAARGRWDDATESKSMQMDASASKSTICNASDADMDMDRDKDTLASKDAESKKRPHKRRYGEYKHVLLTDDQYARLVSEFGEDLAAGGIQAVDDQVQLKGTKYKDHNLAIRKWGIDAAREKAGKAPPGKAEYHNRYNDFPQRDNDYDKIQDDWIRKSFGAPLPVAGRG